MKLAVFIGFQKIEANQLNGKRHAGKYILKIINIKLYNKLFLPVVNIENRQMRIAYAVVILWMELEKIMEFKSPEKRRRYYYVN